ncbi:unnamed protein product [Rhodiola kirilowii]
MGKSSIEAVEEKLPPGFRFYPRDEELICDYLMNKIVMTFDDDATCTNNTNSALLLAVPRLVEVDLNKSEPWDIPETACVGGKQWYFYSRRDKKYATGLRTNRATATGYWKATGKDRGVYSNSSRRGTPLLVGMRKTLVFYRGRAPKGRKSDWVMHEFRLEGSPSPLPHLKFCSSAKEDWVLCRVFHKDKEDTSSRSKQVSGGSSDRIRHDDHYGIQLQTSTSSSSLPPLMDDPYTSFIQTQTSSSNNAMMNHQNHLSNNNPSNNGGNNLQVPCFSIFSQNQTMSYCYPTVVPASVNVPDQQTCTSNSGAYDGVIKQDSIISQQNRALFNTNLKVVFNQVTTTSNDPAPLDKLKSKISSSCDDFRDGNNSPDRDSYLPESMWRHQQY